MIIPPIDPKTEGIVATAKALVSYVPIFGPLLSEVGNLYLNPLDRRKQQWMEDVSNAINTITVQHLIEPKDLEHNERFISTLYRATTCALMTHQREKHEALKHALIASVDGKRLPQDTINQFLRYIDELTVTHFALLSALAANHAKLSEVKSLKQLYELLVTSDGIPLERLMFRQFMRDLDSRSLIKLGDIEEFPEYKSTVTFLSDTASRPAPTEFTSVGHAFLNFVSA